MLGILKPSFKGVTQVTQFTRNLSQKTSHLYNDGSKNTARVFAQENENIFKKDHQSLLSTLQAEQLKNDDLKKFIHVLSHPYLAIPHLQHIDKVVGQSFLQNSAVFQATNSTAQPNIKRLLNELRYVISKLAIHYEFNDTVFEPNSRLLSSESFMLIPEKNCLVLDIGETGHGPIVHSIAACLIKEMEIAGLIRNGQQTYRKLSEPSLISNRENTDLVPLYGFILDNPCTTTLSNPASFANFLIENPNLFPSLSKLGLACKLYCHNLARESEKDFSKQTHLMNWRHPDDYSANGGTYLHYNALTFINTLCSYTQKSQPSGSSLNSFIPNSSLPDKHLQN